MQKIYLPVLFCLISFATYGQSHWAKKGGGITIDEALAITGDANGNTYVTGYFTSNATFDITNLSSSGLSDVFVAKYDPQGAQVWAVRGGGSNDDRAEAIAVDASGNVYVGGYFYGAATFGSSTVTAAGAQDAFVAKLDANGNWLWAVKGGGTGSDIVHGMDTDPSGNVVATGEFFGSATFGVTNLTGTAEDVFVTKIDPAGNFLWTKMGTANLTDRGQDVACDASGNIYVTGQFSNNITFDNMQTNALVNAIFLVKFNASGAEQWFRRIGGGTFNIVSGVDCDNSGNIYLTGDFGGSLVFFPNTSNPLNATYPNNIFIAKYDASGSHLWGTADGSDSPVTSKGIAVSGNSHLFVGGNFECRLTEYSIQYGEATFNSVGFTDAFYTRYDLSGNRVWARNAGGQRGDFLRGIAAASDGHVLSSGGFELNFNIPYSQPNFVSPPGIGFVNNVNPTPYCNDANYNAFLQATSAGSLDAIFGKFIDPTRAPYDFYYRTGNGCNLDTVEGCITLPNDNVCLPESLQVCENAAVQANSHTASYESTVGPLYAYQWNSGSTNGNLNINFTGNYSVNASSLDGCYSWSDTIHVTIIEGPDITISDTRGFNNHDNPPNLIYLCLPDTVDIMGHSNGNLTTFYWTLPNGTVVNDSVISTSASGTYSYTTVNAANCTTTVILGVNASDTLTPLNLEMFFPLDADLNDTISVCQFSYVNYIIRPNPPVTFQNCNGNLNLSGMISPTGQPISYVANCYLGQPIPNLMNVDSSGWYVFDVHFVHANYCDTLEFDLIDSIYIDALPAPVVDIDLIGPTAICPGDSITLTCTGCINNPVWSGNYIPTIDPAVIMVGSPGPISVTCSAVNPLNGCGASDVVSVMITTTPNPVLTMYPSDGLICPGDSVEITSTGSGMFTWFGPGGQFSTGSGTIYLTAGGTYYVVVTDSNGCALVSNTVQISEYTNPFLTAFPEGVICDPGDTVLLQAFVSPGAIVSWNAPLSGSNLTQTVNTPGVYSCNITSCGMNVTASVTVGGGYAAGAITALGPLSFCEGDSVTLEVTPGMESYLWQPSGDTTLQVTYTESGNYYVVVTDSFGCTVQTNSLVVNAVPNDLDVPLADTVFICPPENVVFTAQGSGNNTLYWYDSEFDTSPADSGNSYNVGMVDPGDTVYVYQVSDVGCIGPLLPVLAIEGPCTVIDMPNIFSPNGDGYNDWVEYFILGATCFHIDFYNRWGLKIFETDNPAEPWPGTTEAGEQCVEGVYYYVLRYCPKNLPNVEEYGFIHLVY